jgi:hypothetical protein
MATMKAIISTSNPTTVATTSADSHDFETPPSRSVTMRQTMTDRTVTMPRMIILMLFPMNVALLTSYDFNAAAS